MNGRHRQVRVAIVVLLALPVVGALPGVFATPPGAPLCPPAPDLRHVSLGESVGGELDSGSRCDFILDVTPASVAPGEQILIESSNAVWHVVTLALRAAPDAPWKGACQIHESASAPRCASDFPLAEGEYRITVENRDERRGAFSFTARLVDMTQACDLGPEPIPIAAGETVHAIVSEDLGARCLFRFAGSDVPGHYVRFRVLDRDLGVRLHGERSSAPLGIVSACNGSWGLANVCTFPANGEPIFAKLVRSRDGSAPSHLNVTVETGPVCELENDGRIPEGGSIRGRMAHFDEGGAVCHASFSVLANSSSFLVGNTVSEGSAMQMRVSYEAPDPGTCAVVTSRVETRCAALPNRHVPIRIELQEEPSEYYSTGESDFALTALSYDVCSFGHATLELVPGAPIEASAPPLPLNGCRFRVVPPDANAATRVTVRSLDGAALRFDASSLHDSCSGYLSREEQGSCRVFSAGKPVDVTVEVAAGTGQPRFVVAASFEGPCSLGSGVVRIPSDAVVTGSVRGPVGTACIVELPPLPDGFYDLAWTVSSALDARIERPTPDGTAPVACSLRLPDLARGSCAIETSGVPLRLVARVNRATSLDAAFTFRVDATPACEVDGDLRAAGLGWRATGFLHDYDGVAGSCLFEPPLPDPEAADLLRASLDAGLADARVALAAGEASCEADLRCSIENLGAGPLLATLQGRGRFAFALDAVDGCSVNANRGAALAEGAPTELTVAADPVARCALSFVPEPGAARVSVAVEGDVELLVSTAGAPTRDTFECRAVAGVPCRLDLAGPVLRALVRSTGEESTFRVVARSEHLCSLGAGVHVLAPGETIVARLLDHRDGACEFAVPPGAGEDLAALLAAATENGFVVEASATATGSRCVADVAPATRRPCDVLLGEGGPARVRVSQRAGRADGVAFTLRAETSRIPVLDGVPLSDEVEAGRARYFRVAGPRPGIVAMAPDLACERVRECDDLSLARLRADADLYVGPPDALPSPAAATCGSTLPGRAEGCMVDGPAIVAVRGVAGTARFRVSLVELDPPTGAALARVDK